MIEHVALDTAPLLPGETRELRVWTDTGPLQVRIRCFIEHPPPPQYRPCKECGSFAAGSGEPIRITADEQLFTKMTGYLVVGIVDAAGDERTIELRVEREKEPMVMQHEQ